MVRQLICYSSHTHFRGRGLRVPLPAASRLAALFLALSCLSVGLGPLRGLCLLHLTLLLALFWRSLLAVFSLIRRWATVERSVNPITVQILKSTLHLCDSKKEK